MLALASQASAAITVYTTQASYLAAISSPGVDNYTGFSITGVTPSPITRTAGAYGYTGTAAGNFFGAGTVADPWLSTNTATDPITFNAFTGGTIRGVGGLFFGSNVSGAFQAGDITLTATDAGGSTTVTIVGATTTSFRGFVSDTGITSLVVASVPPATGFLWPTVDNLTLGLAAAGATADLSITKTNGTANSTPGTNTTYTITASNAGPSAATGATVVDNFPAACTTVNWTCVGAGAGTCTAAGSGNINQTVNLPVGGSVTFTAVCAISGAASGNLTNTATVATPVGTTDPNMANNSATDTDTLGAVVVNADVSITKTNGVASSTPGTNTTYVITASNAGPGAAPAAMVTDTFPAACASVTWTCTGAAGGTCVAAGTGNLSQTVGLPSGASVTFTAICALSPSATGSLSNTATIAAGAGITDPTPGNNSATDTDTLVASADLAVTMTDSPDPVVAGTNLTYTVTVVNNGPSDAQGVSISLPLPAGTTFVSATPSAGGVCNATSPVVCTWAGPSDQNSRSANFSRLAPTVTRTVTIVVLVSPAQVGNLSATVTASSATTDPVPGNNSATATTVVQGQADLSITLTDSPDPVTAGSNLTYVATLTNGGVSDAQNASISLPLPAGTTFVSATPSAGGTCNAASPVVCTWAGATASGGTRTVTIVVTVSPAQVAGLSATATASSATTDPAAGNNTATATTGVQGQADLSITLTDSPDPVTAGSNLTYVATLTNGGVSDAQSASISLPLPAGTTFVSATPSAGGTCNAASPVVCTWAGATAPGATRTATIVVSVSPSQVAGLSATATASSATADPVPGNNTATATTAVVASANLALTLTASAAQVALNEIVTFTATSTNLGPSDAQNVVVSITLSPDFRFSSFMASAGAVCTVPQVGLSGVISCTWAGPTAPGATRTLSVSAYSNTAGTSSISAATSSPTADPTPANNTVSTPVTVGQVAAPIPALDLRGLLLLAMLLASLGLVVLRRQD